MVFVWFIHSPFTYCAVHLIIIAFFRDRGHLGITVLSGPFKKVLREGSSCDTMEEEGYLSHDEHGSAECRCRKVHGRTPEGFDVPKPAPGTHAAKDQGHYGYD
jgi:hypothetical protein